jgi:heme/copper-type cytochrome/quinol oxidase subunit 3
MVNEVKLIRSRLNEKAKRQKAQNQLVRLLVASSCLLFLTLLGVWLIQVLPKVTIPKIYYLGSFIIMLSSAGLVATKKAIAKDDLQKAVYLLAISMGLGVAFGFIQLMGWNYLFDTEQLGRNILLPFSTIHFLHLVIGIIFLFIVFKRLNDFQIHSKAMLFSSNVFYFWHFLGFIWLAFMGVMA